MCVQKRRRVAAHPREDFSVPAAGAAYCEINDPKKAVGAQPQNREGLLRGDGLAAWMAGAVQADAKSAWECVPDEPFSNLCCSLQTVLEKSLEFIPRHDGHRVLADPQSAGA
jgi:hypothetical protein